MGLRQVPIQTVNLTSVQTVSNKTATGLKLTAGTNVLAPLLFNAGTNLLTPAAGNAEFDGNLLYFTPMTARRKIALWDFAFVSGANATNNTTSSVPITGLSIALNTNTNYLFEAIISGNSSSAAGTEYTVDLTATGGSVIEATSIGVTTGLSNRNVRINSFGTFDTAKPYLTNGSDGQILIKGFISIGGTAPGNLTIGHVKLTSGTSTVYIGSSLAIWKVS